MRRSLADALVADAPPVPLEVPRGYRDAAEATLEAHAARRATCRGCAGKGCASCADVGWTVEAADVAVPVPAGAAPGTIVTIDGAGDAVGGVVRPLRVALVAAGDASADVRAARADFEHKLGTAWEMERVARANRRQRTRVAVIAAVTVVALVPVLLWSAKNAAGESCASDGDCRSGQCMELRRSGDVTMRWEGSVCTSECRSDLDCPSAMVCRGASQERSTFVAIGGPAGPACIPKGYARGR